MNKKFNLNGFNFNVTDNTGLNIGNDLFIATANRLFQLDGIDIQTELKDVELVFIAELKDNFIVINSELVYEYYIYIHKDLIDKLEYLFTYIVYHDDDDTGEITESALSIKLSPETETINMDQIIEDYRIGEIFTSEYNSEMFDTVGYRFDDPSYTLEDVKYLCWNGKLNV